MFGVARSADEHFIGELGIERRLAAPKHLIAAAAIFRQWRVFLAELSRQANLVRLDVGNRELVQSSKVVRDLDAAPIGQLRDDEPREIRERFLIVQRPIEDVARLRQIAVRLFGALVLGDVAPLNRQSTIRHRIAMEQGPVAPFRIEPLERCRDAIPRGPAHVALEIGADRRRKHLPDRSADQLIRRHTADGLHHRPRGRVDEPVPPF